MLRIGMIGMGFMGRVHYESYDKIPFAKVVAIADRDPVRARGDLSGVWGNLGEGISKTLPMDRIHGTQNFDELLNHPEIDVIDICAPTPEHAELALRALAAGKHVVCEKPLARTAEEARKIAKAARSARGMFMPAMCMRFWPGWTFLAEAVADGRYGKVLAAHFARLGSCPPGWYREGSRSGGVVLDLHIHDIDFIYSLFGRPKGVMSRGFPLVSGEVDHVMTQYLYPTGPVVSATGSWINAPGTPFTMQFQVHFEKATLNFDLSRTQPLMVYQQDKAEAIELPKASGYVGELTYFLECVQRGERPTRVTAEDAVTGLEIAEAERESARSGGIVAL